ncbi:MAG: ribosome recycling factor [Chromatiales bacterium]|nr:ribosome recycling factor [Chromatiales bacterium]
MSLIDETKTKMNKSIDSLITDLSKIRTGRAHPSLLDHITVVYYDAKTPINQISSIIAEDARTLSIKVWEKDSIALIEKAIVNANLGLNPMVKGNVIRVPMPPLTEERRKELNKIVKQYGETAKIAIRNIRRDINQHLKQQTKAKEISRDEEQAWHNDLEKLTAGYVEKIDRLLEQKEKELMEV